MSDVVGYQVAICDTPPGHGAHVNAIANLCAMADLILIPTSSSTDDLSEVVPFRSRVAGNKGVFILNKVNRRTGSFTRARTVLMQGGKLCPVEIPLYEDIHTYFDRGLTALDVDRANGSAELGLVWDFVAQECFAS
jgi:chromosome partitioning protein